MTTSRAIPLPGGRTLFATPVFDTYWRFARERQEIFMMRDADVIRAVTDMQEAEFARLGLTFQTLFGRRLHPIDCQNLFCEIDKYARVAHPEAGGARTKIKQKFTPSQKPVPQWYPPKWGLPLP